ncbi:response regulator transcription factor [Methylobacterium goesingense]|uniref:DNA-binding NarL/FixJ family response regulator n=1 Tax=Methylobacterium goesingense TaxID=243690 RepID=A0ABV2LAN2_9HYPH|nr:response regulator transcription factor [Methylobacterium goesingense]GJD75756.1 Oxygen regulatory protein NreC [Methylobacterium goesingense]
MSQTGTSVLIADDHPVILKGFRTIMEDAGVETIHEATTIVEAYRSFYRLRPAVVIADLTFGDQGISGLSLIRRIRTLEGRTRILAFSMHDDPTIIARALESGATGYVLKDASTDEFLKAFDHVRIGKSYLDHEIALRVAMLNANVQPSPLASLTEREFQVLALLKDGHSYQGIADTLTMKYKTVVNLCSTIRQKLGARNFADLIRIALKAVS